MKQGQICTRITLSVEVASSIWQALFQSCFLHADIKASLMMLALRALVQGCSPKPMLRAKLLRESCDTRPLASVRSSTKARTASLQASVISWSSATSSKTPCMFYQSISEYPLVCVGMKKLAVLASLKNTLIQSRSAETTGQGCPFCTVRHKDHIISSLLKDLAGCMCSVDYAKKLPCCWPCKFPPHCA